MIIKLMLHGLLVSLSIILTITSEAIVIEEKSFRTVAVEVTNSVDTYLITATIVYTTLINIYEKQQNLESVLAALIYSVITVYLRWK